jgi:uncharacterized membrane protein
MVIFHLNYSLVNIFDNNIINFSKEFWFYEWRISALIFIFIWGFSFYLSEKKYWKIVIKKYIKNSFFLAIIALSISIGTYLFFPEQYIKFWIIHFFALSFILLLIFRKFKYYNIIFALVFIIYWFYFIPVIENKYFYFLWFTYNWFNSADYYPILPYFWVILLWYVSALFLDNKNKMKLLSIKTKNKNNILIVFFSYLWKKSLIIYIIHQPIIIFIIYLYYKII